MQIKPLVFVFSAFLAVSSQAQADAEAAKAKATSVCAGCHGPLGVSAADTFPNLAGQKKTYLVNALKSFREKTRTNGIMNGMAAGLTDTEIDDLATYFSGLTPGH